MSEQLTASAVVPTAAAARYLKQLVAHLGHKAEVRTEGDGERLLFGTDSCLLATDARALYLHATGDTPEGLRRVQEVVGRHLERFAQRDGLTVEWHEAA